MRLQFLFAILICIAAASAEISIALVQHDTDVQSTFSQLKVCSCGSATDEFTVKNVGQLDATYTFNIDADQPWFTLEKYWAYLKAGESTTLTVFINAPCGAQGTGSYKLYVTSEYGRYRALESSVETGVCQNIQATLNPQYATVQPCTTQNFTLNITNTATFRERYTVDGLGFSPVTLDPQQSKLLTGSYSAACDEWGTKQLPVTVYANTNDRSETLSASVTVPRAYDYNISLGTVPALLCAGVPASIPVTVRNTENRANTFTLSGEPWSNSTQVYVGANSSIQTSLLFTPLDAGDRQLTIQAKGLNGTINKQLSKVLSVQACYGFTVESTKQVNTCPGTVYIPFTITSQGTQEQSLSLDVQSNATTTIDSLNATLHPSEVLTKTVGVDVPDADRQYYVTLNASTPYTNQVATTSVNGYSTQSCYKVEPTNTHLSLWTDQAVQPIIIKQSGIQPAVYTISYNGTLGQMLEQNVSLGPQSQAVLHLMLNTSGYTQGRYLGRLTLTTANVDYTSDLELQLREKGFWEQFLDACYWNDGFAVCSVASSLSFVIMLLVLLAVLGIIVGFVHYENPPSMSKQTAGLIGAGLLILLLVAMIASAPAVPRSYVHDIKPANESALHYEVGAGQVLTINASNFFYDPDKDSLSISASQPQHLQVRMDHGVAYIRPQDNYGGSDTLVFSANDNKGGVTDSDLITIDVVPFKPVSLLQLWQYSCWFSTYLFLFIAIAFALLTVLFVKDVKAEHESRKAIVLYRRPRVPVVRKSRAQDLVEQVDTSIKTIPPGTSIGQVIGTQNISTKGEQVYVASQDGTKFHRITCPIVKNMPKENRLTFSTKEDAIKAGYTPCKTCSSHD